ncbi:hypothetical protein AB6A40_005439 [Gnathostoma spinigerum]|uniref:Uncharacterized protein n=1 Tax=Gnathostoma spinigerum TaxID=75299 RepID=A0ABD6EGK6_9BILA
MGCDCCIISAIGWACVTYGVYTFLTMLYNIFFPYVIAGPIDYHKVAGAKWAVVTGSTDGIGKAYAMEFAKKGFSIVLVSRTLSKLEEVKAEIVKDNKVEVKIIQFDFTTSDGNEYTSKLLSELSGLDIGILVNNVGLSYEYPEVLHKVEGGLQKIRDIAVVNMLPPTLLCAAVLPQMVERNAGIVINVASAAAYHQIGLWAVYSASKRYLLWITGILQREYSRSSIIFQTVCPMLVATKMSRVRESFFCLPPDKFAREAVKSIGHASETTGCMEHQLQVEILRLLPKALVEKILFDHSEVVRKKALSKRQSGAKKTE